jgi:internalin A
MADEKRILKLIELAAKERWKTLNLSDYQLISLPLEVTKLTSLTGLNLTRNNMANLPKITKLTNLTYLNLFNNQLTSVPPEITTVTRLTS